MYKYATAWVVNKIANKNIYTPPNFINPVDKVSAGFLVHFEISVLKLYIYIHVNIGLRGRSSTKIIFSSKRNIKVFILL